MSEWLKYIEKWRFLVWCLLWITIHYITQTTEKKCNIYCPLFNIFTLTHTHVRIHDHISCAKNMTIGHSFSSFSSLFYNDKIFAPPSSHIVNLSLVCISYISVFNYIWRCWCDWIVDVCMWRMETPGIFHVYILINNNKNLCKCAWTHQ